MDGKKLAGEKAVELVKDGMLLGLGSGSTVYWSIGIIELGALVEQWGSFRSGSFFLCAI
jgi:ribose 5-phosphate isomerase A